MKEFENIHKGETGIIIGNGPSLNKAPRDLLEKYPSFGTNRIYLFPDFTPTYYVAVNPLVIDQSWPNIELMPCHKFIRAAKANLFTNVTPLPYGNVREFSYKPWLAVNEGWTVTFVCMELAYYMGFETILLIGVDHRYKYDGNPNQEVVAKDPDPNHFSEEYFGPGVRWNLPDLERSYNSYTQAEEAYRADGRKIINLTPRSALDVFEKGKYADWE